MADIELLIQNNSGVKIAELKDQNIRIAGLNDMVDLLGNAFYLGTQNILIRSDQLPEGFLELKNGIAGELLQKVSNYRMRLVILGDFSTIESKSLRDFIYESNNSGFVYFVANRKEAIQKLKN